MRSSKALRSSKGEDTGKHQDVGGREMSLALIIPAAAMSKRRLQCCGNRLNSKLQNQQAIKK